MRFFSKYERKKHFFIDFKEIIFTNRLRSKIHEITRSSFFSDLILGHICTASSYILLSYGSDIFFEKKNATRQRPTQSMNEHEASLLNFVLSGNKVCSYDFLNFLQV